MEFRAKQRVRVALHSEDGSRRVGVAEFIPASGAEHFVWVAPDPEMAEAMCRKLDTLPRYLGVTTDCIPPAPPTPKGPVGAATPPAPAGSTAEVEGEWDDYTKAELLAHAEGIGVEVSPRMTKPEIIAAIEAAD